MVWGHQANRSIFTLFPFLHNSSEWPQNFYKFSLLKNFFLGFYLLNQKWLKSYDNFAGRVDFASWLSCIKMGGQSTVLSSPVLMVVTKPNHDLFLFVASSLFPINCKWRKVLNKSVSMNRKSIYVNSNPLLRHKYTLRLASRKKIRKFRISSIYK